MTEIAKNGKIAMSKLNRGLIVSCQAVKGEPLYGYGIMHLFAKAAKAGGACGIRALCDDVPSIREEVDLPIIGLVKQVYCDSEIYITPTKAEIDRLLEVPCDVVCMDATDRPRPNGETLEELYAYAREHCGARELMADISTLEEALYAENLGFDYVSTTLRGYTRATQGAPLPDIDFMAQCKAHLTRTKLIAEGGVFEAAHMEQISRINPYAVVVGSAITRPKVITERLDAALKLRED